MSARSLSPSSECSDLSGDGELLYADDALYAEPGVIPGVVVRFSAASPPPDGVLWRSFKISNFDSVNRIGVLKLTGGRDRTA